MVLINCRILSSTSKHTFMFCVANPIIIFVAVAAAQKGKVSIIEQVAISFIEGDYAGSNGK
eukprot:m.38402 g.38402  ORF g.38402 m.38402 type:complete len:61 (+) comp10214_c0_seq2:353-535(+)